jgi:hypothetical protein
MTPSGPSLAALQFRPPPAEGRSRAPWIALPLVLFVHWAALEVLRSPPWQAPAIAERVLEVVFIETSATVSLPPPAWPAAPPRRASHALRATFRTAPATAPPPATVVEAPEATAPRLFDDDGQVRLPAMSAPAPSFAAPRPDARRFGQRIDSLPGSDRPMADIGTVVRVPPSPEQRVMQIASFVGLRRPPTDDCRSVERRLLSETNAVARAIAMETFERRCRGWK